MLRRTLSDEEATGDSVGRYALAPEATGEVAAQLVQAGFGSRVGVGFVIGDAWKGKSALAGQRALYIPSPSMEPILRGENE